MHIEGTVVIKQKGTDLKTKETPNKHQLYLITYFLTGSPVTCEIGGGELKGTACVEGRECARHCESSFTKFTSCVRPNSPVR